MVIEKKVITKLHDTGFQARNGWCVNTAALGNTEKPLDLYRAHFWHAEFSHEKRTPFAAIYTSLGCRFACDFCMINIVNRVDNADDINASHSKGMRYWSPKFIIKEFEKLAELGVETIRISDEMFFLSAINSSTDHDFPGCS